MGTGTRQAWVFFQRDLLIEWGSRFSLLLHLLNIGLTVASYLFLSRLVGRESLARWAPADQGYFPFVLIGTATSGAMLMALMGLSRGLQLQQPSGVLKPLFFRSVSHLFYVIMATLGGVDGR